MGWGSWRASEGHREGQRLGPGEVEGQFEGEGKGEGKGRGRERGRDDQEGKTGQGPGQTKAVSQTFLFTNTPTQCQRSQQICLHDVCMVNNYRVSVVNDYVEIQEIIFL